MSWMQRVSHTDLCHGNNLSNPWGGCRNCRHQIIHCDAIFREVTDALGLWSRWEQGDAAVVAAEARDARRMTRHTLNLNWSCDIRVLHASWSHGANWFALPERQGSNCSTRYCRAWSCEGRSCIETPFFNVLDQRAAYVLSWLPGSTHDSCDFGSAPPWLSLTKNSIVSHHPCVCPRVSVGRHRRRESQLSPSWQTETALALWPADSCPQERTWTAETQWTTGRCLQPNCL